MGNLYPLTSTLTTSPRVETETGNDSNVFIGARSYEEMDKEIFFGREEEINDLFQLININTFTLLYGRSGLGKTSLLKAGLFPRLRNAKYLPIYIKPNYTEEKKDFIKSIENKFTRKDSNVIIPERYQVDQIKSKESLWEFFNRTPIKDAQTNSIITPVLVFDQFEEIFTLGTKDKSSDLRSNIKNLIEFLGDLIENIPPEYLEEHQRIDLQYLYASRSIPLKILFSFREEYLSDFYSLSKYIPSIAYSNLQYRLNPLNFDKGYKVIKQASRGLFEEDAILETLRIITESQTIDECRERDVDSFLLSVFCEDQIKRLKNGEENNQS